MLHYVVLFFILAVVSAFLGFGGLAGAFSLVAKILSGVFVISLLVSLIGHFFPKSWMISGLIDLMRGFFSKK